MSKSVAEKVEKQIPEFVAEVEAMSPAEMKQRLATLAQHEAEIDNAEENDVALQIAKSEVKDIKGPYAECRKLLRLRSRYICEQLDNAGAGVETDEA